MNNRKILLFFLLIFSSIKCFSATYVVTSNADSGTGTLRDAITRAVTNSGGTINFNLSTTVAGRTITLLSQLPALPSNLTIDATGQAGTSFGVSKAKVAIFYQTPVEQNLSGLAIINQNNVTIMGLYINNTTYVGGASKNYFWRGIQIEGGSNITISENVITGFYFPVSANWQAFGLSTSGLVLQNNILGVDIDGITLPANSELYTVLENLDGDIMLGIQGKGNYFATGLSITGNNTTTATNNANVSIAGNYIGVNYTNNIVTQSFGLSVQNITTSNIIYIQDNIIDNQLGIASIYLNVLSKVISVVRNYIGVDRTLTKNYTTSLRGIYVDGCPQAQVQIGDNVSADANFIANCKPVEINNSEVAVSRNSFFCTVHEYPMYDEANSNVPVVNIANITSSSVSGNATPNSMVQLFYSDKCNTCSPQTYFASVTAAANGTWGYNQPITGGVIASATLNGYTSEFTTVSIDSSKVKVANACTSTTDGSITGMIPYSAINLKWVDKSGVTVGTMADLTAKPGIYKLEIDNGSCQASSAYYQIKVNFVTDISHAVLTNSTCGNNNGAISGIIVQNNVPGITDYAWTDAAGKLWGSGLDLENVPAGSYSLTLSPADKTCTDVLGPFVIKNADGPAISETGEQVQQTSCSKSTGAITGIQVTGGSGNYSYVWWNGQQQTVGAQKDLTGQPAGTYQLEVTDGSQCGGVYSSFITIQAINGVTLDETGAAPGPATCGMANGSVTGIKATGATTYTWADATGKTYNTPTPDLTNAFAGTYTLTASNTSGCSTTSKTYTITQPAATRFSGYIVTQGEPCFGKNNGSLTVMVDNLVKSERWVTPQNVSLNGTSISNLAAGTYALFLTDQNGCEGPYGTYILTTIPQLVIADKGDITNSDCGLSNGSINGLLLSGGLPPFNYEWTDANENLIGINANNLANVPAGSYGLRVSDAGCGLATATYTILDNSIDIQTPSVSNVQLCSGGNVVISVNNPDPTSVYRLYNSPAGTQAIQEETGGQFTINVNGNSTFYISRVNGSCESAKAQVNVLVGISTLAIANTFTPNGDGHNDFWQINNIENYPSALVQVFNRYGQKVYESRGYSKPFDGTYSGQKLPTGVYYYIINLSANCHLLSGSITIVR